MRTRRRGVRLAIACRGQSTPIKRVAQTWQRRSCAKREDCLRSPICRKATRYFPLGSKLDALAAAKSAYEAAVIEKDGARTDMIDTLRPFVAQFQANPSIPVKVFESLDIPARGTTGPRSAPTIPTNLVATPNANGSVVLTFNKAGNSALTPNS